MIRILIAETEEALRILLSQELEEEGYEVVAVPPERLEEQLAAKKPSLVLLSVEHLTFQMLSTLQETVFPVLAYGPWPRDPAASAWWKNPRIAAEEFNLRRIKGRIRELLGRSPSPSSAAPRSDEVRRPYIRRIQMHFAFPWSAK